jgi:hypothetical protein
VLSVDEEAVMTPDQGKAFAEHVMPLFLESAKTYAQLAPGTIALSAAFREKILGEKGGGRFSGLLVSSWLLLLISIGAGAFYTYLGIRIVDYYITGEPYWLHADIMYATMMVTFFAGAALLVIALTQQLLQQERRP